VRVTSKRPRRAGLGFLISLALVVVAGALPAPALGGPNFAKVATHPQAAAQPTAVGRTIATLKAWNGKLYPGYGDYGANTGPIAITPFDGSAFASPPELAAADTEAIWIYRTINGKLYAPSIDPRVDSDFAVGTSGANGPTWLNPSPIGTTHAYDMVTLTGRDLWLVGSSGHDATAWRSLDGGSNWIEQLRVPPINTTGDFARFYGAAVYGGKLYVQAVDHDGGEHPYSKVFDGTAWSDGPSLGDQFSHAETFAGKLVFHGRVHSGNYMGPLRTFDGNSATSVLPSIYDYTVAGKTVYALAADGAVLKSKNLSAWRDAATAPPVARSIGVLDGRIYLGGTDSGLYRK
jgi:hypothetical protein